MTSMLNKAAEDALAEFRHYQALGEANYRRAERAIEAFLRAVAVQPGETLPEKLPECVRVWTRWLMDHGPNTRQHITKATGVKFSERGTPHTICYDDVTSDENDAFPPNTIVRFNGYRPNSGRGRAPVVFGLWSQRYEVNRLYGIGPGPDGPPEEPKAMTGVIQPPVSSHPIDPEFGQEEPFTFDGEDLSQPSVVPTVTDEPEPFDHVAWAKEQIAKRDGIAPEEVLSE